MLRICLLVSIVRIHQTSLVLNAYASSEGSFEPVRPHSLNRSFAARAHIVRKQMKAQVLSRHQAKIESNACTFLKFDFKHMR